MTREEIERSFQYNMTNAFIEGWYEKNHERYTEEIEDVFYEGADAAQKYLIDKACEWLDKTIDEDVFVNCGSVIKIMPANEFVKYFRKAMEE